MRLVLSDAEQTQLAETARVLLSPLDEPVDAWRAQVLEHLTRLLDAPMAGFILPTAEPPHWTLHNLPDSFASEYFASTYDVDTGMTTLQQQGASIWSTRLLLDNAGLSVEEGWFARPEYRAFYSRYGIQEGMGYMVPPAEPPLVENGAVGDSPDGIAGGIGAVLTCFHDVWGTDVFGERGLAKLRLLLPALEAGVAMRVRLGWLRRTLHEALDAVQDGLQVRDGAGRVLHANTALGEMLDADAERDLVDTAMERVCGALRVLLSTPAGAAGVLEQATTEVRTHRARYRVRGQFVTGSTFGRDQVIIVSVARLTPLPLSAPELQERWALTPQEARVALLLAEGAGNARIAATLQISPATARHYTEAVFLKLQVRTRAEAARRLLVE